MTIGQINALTLETHPYVGDPTDSQAVKDAWLALEKAKMLEALAEMTATQIVEAERAAKIQERKNRINVMFDKDSGLPWKKLIAGVKDEPNALKYLNDLIESDSIDPILTELENAQMEWETEQAAANLKKQEAETVKEIKRRSVGAYDAVIWENFSTGKTIEQIDQMEVDFAGILKALKNDRPDKAKKLILEVIAPEYTALKTKLLTILDGG